MKTVAPAGKSMLFSTHATGKSMLFSLHKKHAFLSTPQEKACFFLPRKACFFYLPLYPQDARLYP